jgi:hypothetical protein
MGNEKMNIGSGHFSQRSLMGMAAAMTEYPTVAASSSSFSKDWHQPLNGKFLPVTVIS